jgi:threonine dehydratase
MKIASTRALGAEVVLYDRATEDRDAIGAGSAPIAGLTLIKPYDEPEVIAGQGTCGLEIAEQAAEYGIAEAEVLVCCGGGGFASGIALALEADAPTPQRAACGARRLRRWRAACARAHRAQHPPVRLALRRDPHPSTGRVDLSDPQRLAGPGWP